MKDETKDGIIYTHRIYLQIKHYHCMYALWLQTNKQTKPTKTTPPKNPNQNTFWRQKWLRKIKTNTFILPSCWMEAKWEKGGILRFQITGSKRAGKTSDRLSLCSFSNFWTGPVSFCAWWEETVEDYCIFCPQMTQKHLVSECDTFWWVGGASYRLHIIRL